MSEVNPFTQMIKPHAELIIAQAEAGDKTARAVIVYYEMHRACPSDPGAQAFLDLTFKQWMEEQRA